MFTLALTPVLPPSSMVNINIRAEDPFVRQEPPTPSTKPPRRLQEMMLGTASSVSHPRGSLFGDDDVGMGDVGPEQEEPLGTFPQSIIASDSGSPQRVVSPPPQSRVAASRDGMPRWWLF